MTARILVETSPGEARIAVASDRALLDYALWRPGAPDGVGDLHLGRVIACVPAMGGAFVALAGAEGFLPDAEGGKAARAGEPIPVRVMRAAQGGKGPRLAAANAPEGSERSGPPRLLRRGPGPLEELSARYPDATIGVDDAALLAELRPVLGPRVAAVRQAFEPHLAEQIGQLSAVTVDLAAGARAHFWPTPALTAIDLDAGGASADRRDKAAAQEALNRSSLPALARQIRLRNLSGAIVVDFAGMPARRRAALAPALAAALAEDPLRPRLLGFTRLGLAEIVRPRVHPPLHEALAGPHAAGLAALARAEAECSGAPTLSLVLRAAPDVIAALDADAAALVDFRRRTGRALPLRSDPALPPGSWRLEPVVDRPRSMRYGA